MGSVSHEPLVSIVLPCFNAERFLDATMDSLAGQTHRNLEIVALDDGSTDRTLGILTEWAGRDQRIRILPADTNRGLIATLNRGVQAAQGEFIARMDADDLAAPTRISRQLELLLTEPGFDLVGTGIRVVDADTGRPLTPRPVRCSGPAGARFAALFTNPVAHMTVLVRREVMRRYAYGVGSHSLHTEDYELWTRMLSDGVRIANLDEMLVTVRASCAGVSLGNEQMQIENFVRCALAHLRRATGVTPGPGVHRVLVNRLDSTVSPKDLREGLGLLDQLARRAVAESPQARADIYRTAALQELDIILQALIKCPPLRIEASRRAMRFAPRALSRPIPSYVACKIWTRVSSRAGARFHQDRLTSRGQQTRRRRSTGS